MKKLFKGALFLALIGTVIVGCEKEEAIQPEAQTNPTNNVKLKEINSKSAYNDVELMAMASNIEAISYNSTTGLYEIGFYGNILDHSVEIIEWNDDFIELEIVQGTNTYSSEINASNEEVTITGLGVYTFEAFDDVEVNLENNVLENITSIIPAFHLEHENSSLTFDDNGSSDTYPVTSGSDRIRFWHTTSVVVSPCFQGTEISKVSYERFWLIKGSKLVTLPC
jgi:hypothetical protein